MISIWVVIVIILAAINAHAFKTKILISVRFKDIVRYFCRYTKESSYFRNFIWPWMDFLLISLLPMVIMLSRNVVIIVTFLKAKRVRKDRMQTSARDESAAITGMLIGVSVLFFVATTPSSIYFIGSNNRPPKTIIEAYRLNIAYSLVNIVYYFSNSLNVMVCCFSGSKFSQALVTVLCCRNPNSP
ncbi:hypothetical protein LSH36_316g02015 [Paralvinella palmiformis]|uniref:G-protein coupled receptors family 1 profile domain-containing protein n=1 Tax=Paralvinella palmiformis TaxID=53620 RepID=A0AAD9JH25_9ANNE|nr:hypothetical protein LSH36_316g02015 [Paralvinella palmiformis]